VTFPKFKLWWVCESMYARDWSMHQKCSNYALTNLLFGLCKSMWIIDPLVIRPSPHLGAPSHPSTVKVLQAKEHTSSHFPSDVFTFGLAIESIQKFEGASHGIKVVVVAYRLQCSFYHINLKFIKVHHLLNALYGNYYHVIVGCLLVQRQNKVYISILLWKGWKSTTWNRTQNHYLNCQCAT